MAPTRGHAVRILGAKSHHRLCLHFRSSLVHAYTYADIRTDATVYTCQRKTSTTVSGRIVVYSCALGLPRQGIANNDRINQGKKTWNTKGNRSRCHRKKRKMVASEINYGMCSISEKFANLISKLFSPAYAGLSMVYWWTCHRADL